MTWTVEYHSFSPTIDLIRHLKDELDNLTETSPYASSIKMILTRKDNTFQGELRVNSTNRKFVSSAKCDSLPELESRLLSEINRQLKEWKYLRAV
ncbi:MAG: hypothetical protein AB7N80_15535 [Bdellovibrionales bacterium]